MRTIRYGNSVKIHRSDAIPRGYDEGYDISQFDSDELNKIKDLKIQEVWYWYARGSYCGSGQLLIKSELGWYLYDCSHCSCYGALEGLIEPNFDKLGEPTLMSLYNNCSVGLRKEIDILIDMAEKDGYKYQ